MADTPDAGWLRYPSMTPPAETEPPADPRDLARYPSMPDGRVPDKRVPRHPEDPADPAAPPPEAAAAEGEPAPAPDTAPELPPEYAGVTPPEGLEIDREAFAAVAPDLRKLNLDRAQVDGLLRVYAGLQQREDAAAAATQASWRQEVERTLTPEARQSIGAVMRGAPREVRDLLNRTGVGDNPHLVRWVAELGRRLGGVAPAEDPHRNRYPNTRWS